MRTLVMTGGTRGFGLRTVETVLARPDWRVIVLARKPSASVGQDLKPHPRLEIVDVDLADLKGVDLACDAVLQRLGSSPIAALVLNAGLQMNASDVKSADGLEIHFAVNHLAHALIAERLGAKIEAGGRVVVTSSVVHDPEAFCIIGISRATWQDPLLLADNARSQENIRGPVNRGESRYAASKLCNVMFARALAQERPDLSAVSFNPGVVPGTGIARERGAVQQFLWTRVAPIVVPIAPGMRTVEQSASDLAWLVLDADLDGRSGTYYDGRTPSPGSKDSRDRAKIDRLMLGTRELLQRVVGADGERARG